MTHNGQMTPTDPRQIAPSALDRFSAPTRRWFSLRHQSATAVQEAAWTAIESSSDTLVTAPTGSGKTLAAFLLEIDALMDPTMTPTTRGDRCRVLYVSPLKALANDVQLNLMAPLQGIAETAVAMEIPHRDVTVAVRTADTPAADRRRFATRPSDILVTTPESLYLILTSAARSGLHGVRTVIIDEIHALAGTKRGAHLAVSLERLGTLTGQRPQRVGLSATVAPLERVAEFLSGNPHAPHAHPTLIVAPPSDKHVALNIVVPVKDLTDLPSAAADLPERPQDDPARNTRATATIWPHIEERIVDLVAQQRTTLIFVNSRRTAEKLTARINETWAAKHGTTVADTGTSSAAEVLASSPMSAGVSTVIARAHHGSMSHDERKATETGLKDGTLRAVVATASLELGIDMGHVDLVIQVGAPPSVASGLQRVGRAGHQVGATSQGTLFPLYRGELIPSVVTCLGMAEGDVERVPELRNPLDVLAQQIVAIAAMDDIHVTNLRDLMMRSQPFALLGQRTFDGVLDMLSGQSLSEALSTLRPRITWDRGTNVIRALPSAKNVAVTSGGTIPDRGYFGVYLAVPDAPDTSKSSPSATSRPRARRVGELDEEMVFESHVGDVFTLGTSSWRILEINADRVIVAPAPGSPGRLPFWKGDSPGRPAQLGGRLGRWLREQAPLVIEGASMAPVPRHSGPVTVTCDAWSEDNMRAYLQDQMAATGMLPDDRHIVVETFPDVLGDWMIVIHSLWGARVNGPWTMVLRERLREKAPAARFTHSDDGIIIRVPAEDDPPRILPSDLLIAPEDLDDVVRQHVVDSAHFAARFREAAARALVLPRGAPNRRRPLWQQRLRAGSLLEASATQPNFPLTIEALRECVEDDFDLSALRAVLDALQAGEISLHQVATPSPSPFAQHIAGDFTAKYLYEEDAPLAERRAAALSLDPALLREVLGESHAATVPKDEAVLHGITLSVGWLTEERLIRNAEDVASTLRWLGPSRIAELRLRMAPDLADQLESWLNHLEMTHRAIHTHPPRSEESWWAMVEDASMVRDALGHTLPHWVPMSLRTAPQEPLADLLRRRARTVTSLTATALAAELGLDDVLVQVTLESLAAQGALVPDTFHLDGFCDKDVALRIRKQSMAAARAKIAPVPLATYANFLPRWHGWGNLRGIDGVLQTIDRLDGAPILAASLEESILSARVDDYEPWMLDELTSTGEVVWSGTARPGSRQDDTESHPGWVRLHRADHLDRQPRPLTAREQLGPSARSLLAELETTGSQFATALHSHHSELSSSGLADALWEVAWAGYATNDRFAVLRARAEVTAQPSTPARASHSRPGRTGLRSGLSSRALRTASAHRSTRSDLAGRWSALAAPTASPEVQAAWLADSLLNRHGVVTRDIIAYECLPTMVLAVQQVLRAEAELGTIRRGYFVEGLAGTQYATTEAIDALRVTGKDNTVVLAATDPAQAYGVSVDWPSSAGSHLPGRRAGAFVVLRNGELVCYLERGGRSLLSFAADSDTMTHAARAIVEAVAQGRLSPPTIATINSDPVLAAHRAADPASQRLDDAPRHTTMNAALRSAGFILTPRGLRLPRSH